MSGLELAIIGVSVAVLSGIALAFYCLHQARQAALRDSAERAAKTAQDAQERQRVLDGVQAHAAPTDEALMARLNKGNF